MGAPIFSFGALVIPALAWLTLIPAASGAEPPPLPVIKVMVVYTPAVLQDSGSALPAQIQRVVDEANGVFLNSMARARVRLVHTAKVAYVEPPTQDPYQLQLTLDRLTNPQDGYLDEVPALRAQYGADVVVLLVKGASASGQDGFLAPLRPDAAHGYGVLTSTSDYAFTRLMGRLLGCEAQRGPVEETGRVVGEGAFPDSHACLITNRSGGVYSTIMGARITLLPFFSNPNLSYFGNLMGIPGAADNVRTINLIAPEVAGFSGVTNWVYPPEVQWLTPPTGARFLPGIDVSLQVAVSATAGAAQKVEFYQADSPSDLIGRLLATDGTPDASGHFGVLLTNAPAGWYHLSARAMDDYGEIGQAAIEFQVRAQNDDFTNRIQLRVPSDRLALNLAGMSLEQGEEALAPAGVEATAWYTSTAPDDGFLQAQARAKDSLYLSPLVRAYFGSDLATLTPAGINPDHGAALFLRVQRGQVVQLSVGCARTEAVPTEFAVDFLPLLTNDSFETRLPIAGPAVTIVGHNVEARSATNAVWPTPPGPTVWWSWTPTVSGIAQAQASNFAPYQVITIFKGDQPQTLSLLSQMAPYYPGSVSQGFLVQAGEPLPIAVSSWPGNAVGAFSFKLAVLDGAPNSSFSNRLSRVSSEWSETLVFPGGVDASAPAGVGPYATWWEWTAPENGTAMIAISGWGAPRVSVLTGDSLATLQPAPTLRAGWGQAVFPVIAGARYQLALSWDSIPYYLGAGFAPVLHFGFLPANDSFAQRIVVSGSPVDWSLTNALGTTETGEPTSALASWWYSWTAPARGRATLAVTDAVAVAVFRGSALGQLTNVLSPRYWDPLPNFLAEAGVEYQIALQAGDLSSLPASAHVHLQMQSPPANDDFSAGQLLTGPDYVLSPDLELATADVTDPAIPNAGNSPRTLWWRWIVPADGIASFSASASSLGIYQGVSPAGLTPVGYFPSPGESTYLRVTAGQVLQLMLAGDGYYRPTLRLQLLPQWANDSFAGRAMMEPSPNNPFSLHVYGTTTQGATREGGENLSGTNTARHTRWWTWQTPIPATARLTVSPATGAAYVEQFRGSQLSTLRSVSWQQAPFPTLRFHADPGFEYPLAIDAVGSNDLSCSIDLELIPDAPAPANDSFAQAQVLEGPSAKVRGTHRAATAEPGEPAHGGLAAARSLWWRWTAVQTGRVRLSAKPFSSDAAVPLDAYPAGTLSLPHQPRLGIYIGDTLPALQAQPFQEIYTTNAYATLVEFDAVANQSYALALDGGDPTDADVGEFELQLVQLPANDDFADRIVLQGEVALLSGTVLEATRATNEWIAQWPSSWPSPSLMNVWWEWTAPADLRVTLRNLHPDEHFWAVWRSGDNRQYPPRCSVMDRYFGWEDTRRDFVAHAGDTFEIAVYADPANTTPVEIELEGVPVPSNDDFAGRIPLTGERLCLSARGDNTSRELNEPPQGIGTVSLPYGKFTNAPSLWWSWTAPRSGLFALTTEAQAALQPQLTGPWDQVVRADCFVYQGDQITNLSLIAGTAPDTTSPPSGMKRVTFAATAGGTYQIALCPIITEKRVWDTAKYFVNLAIDPVPENSSPDTALELVGSSPSFSGNLRAGVDGLWWRWTAPQTGTYGFAQRLGGADLSRQLLFQTYSQDPVSSNLVACDISAPAQAGQTYWFKVSLLPLSWWETPPTWDGRDLPFDAALGLTRQATNNDNFAQREPLSGPVAALVGDNTDATREPGEPMHAGAPGRGSLWWQWTAPHSGRWTLATGVAWWRPLLIDVYQGGTLTSLVRVPTKRNALANDLVFDAQAGQTYAIAVDNPTYTTGPFEVDLFESFAPANDSFASRIQLDGNAPSWTARNTGAFAEAGEPDHAACAPAASVWWTWTAPNSGPVLLSVNTADNTALWARPRLAIYTGDSLPGLMPIADNRIGGELATNLAFHAEAGVSYVFVLDTSLQDTGNFRLALTPTNAPANDDFANRFVLTGAQAQTEAFNYGATLEPGEPIAPEAPLNGTLWWTWTAPGSGPTTIDTTGSAFDTGVAAYQGTTLASLVLVGSNDDASSLPGTPVNFGSRLTFNTQAGATYQIQVGSVTGDRGLVSLTLLGPNAPPAELLSAEVPDGADMCLLHLRGTPSQRAWILASTDLANWQWVGSVQFISADAVWSEQISPIISARFYRVVSPQ